MRYFLAPQAHGEQGVWLRRFVGGVCGLLISLLNICWQEQNAQDQGLELAQEKTQVQMSFNQIVMPSPEDDSTRLVDPVQSNHAPHVPHAAATDMRQRLQFLVSRQSERQGLSEVQSYLLQGRAHHSHAKVEMKLLEWQEGKMVWEGQVMSAQDLAPLHQRLLTFSNWHEVPTWPQFQWVAPTAQTLSPDSPRYAFRMQAQLKSSLSAVSAPQKPQALHHE
jgi:hypothetical protein